MKIIVGLGNPGLKYRKTKHNIGFLALDRFVKGQEMRFSASWQNKKKYHASLAKGMIGTEEVVCLKPLTYMNLSGVAVEAVVKNAPVAASDILVICDDADLELGALRIKRSGSSGGHKGLASIAEHLKTESFARLKIGVGRDARERDLARHVLAPFSGSDARIIDDVLDRASQATYMWLTEGADSAMNAFNKTKTS